MEENNSQDIPELSEMMSESNDASSHSKTSQSRTIIDYRVSQILTKDKFYQMLNKNTWANCNSLNACLRNIKVRLEGPGGLFQKLTVLGFGGGVSFNNGLTLSLFFGICY
jgi:hypothetical protein